MSWNGFLSTNKGMNRDLQSENIDKKRILQIFSNMDSELCGLQRRLKIYCLGGTKMTLCDLRDFSRDLDFIVSREDWRVLSGITDAIEQKERIRLDVFPDGQLPGYNYENYAQNARRMPYFFNQIEIYVIDEADFILTKMLAGRSRDQEDITAVLEQTPVSRELVLERYGGVKIAAGKEALLRTRFHYFLDAFMPEDKSR